MKKSIISLVLALSLVFALCTSAAQAVEIINPTDPQTTLDENGDVELTLEQAYFILAKNGKVVGQLTKNEGKKVLAINTAETAITGTLTNGKLVRAKNRMIIELNADNHISSGAQAVDCYLVILDQEVMSGLQLGTAAEVVDATIEAVPNGTRGNYIGYHRFLDSDRGVKVAEIRFSETKYASVWLTDWDGDGDEELCLRAGTAPKSNNGGDNGNQGGDDGNQGGTDFTIGDDDDNGSDDDNGDAGDTDFTIGGDDSSNDSGDSGFTIDDSDDDSGNAGWTI